MTEKLFLLLAGFFLTTICGGLIATLLQHRAWRHKWATEAAEKRAETTKQVFEEISRLMDRRLFRINQLELWLRRQDKARVDIAMQNYRDVLFEWNDSINRHLAMLQIYFGNDIREEFDCDVGARFVEIGSLVEAIYRQFAAQSEIGSLTPPDRERMERLRLDVYRYNLKMLRCIEAQGRALSETPSAIAEIKAMLETKRVKSAQ